MSFKTADLCDDFIDELNIPIIDLKSFGGKTSFSGPISTVRVYEDNVLVKQALETIPEGNVLVVDGGGSKRRALMGDRLADIAVRRKLAGVIIYGCIRDSLDISNMDVGVFALGTNPQKSRKDAIGESDVALKFGGIDWNPGDYVYADEDGIVIAKRKLD